MDGKDTETATSPAFTPATAPPMSDEDDDEQMFPTSTSSSKADVAKLAACKANSSSGEGSFSKQTHQPTGYQWTRDEDAPGYAWKSKKGRDEQARALDQVVDKDNFIGLRYGDIGLDDKR